MNAFRTIAITSPHPVEGEAAAICRLLEEGCWRIHLRKPGYSLHAMRQLVEAIPAECRPRLVVHDHFGLCGQFGLGGIHLNRRHPTPPPHFTGTVSRSCHTLEEVRQYKTLHAYVFLSPVFDSLSKQGYRATFGRQELEEAAEKGIIDSRVIALGGITPDKFEYLRRLRFGGAAMLGSLWNRPRASAFPPG